MFQTRTTRNVESRGMAPVTVYGTSWCAQTQMVRRYLRQPSYRPGRREYFDRAKHFRAPAGARINRVVIMKS